MLVLQIEINEQLNKTQAMKLCKWIGTKLQKMGLSGEVRTIHKGIGNNFGVRLDDDDILDLGIGSPIPEGAPSPNIKYSNVTNPDGLGEKTTLQKKDPSECKNEAPTLLGSDKTSFINPFTEKMNLEEE